MLKILEFYVLLLFTVGYHGNQNIFVSMTVLFHNLIMLNICFMGFQSDMNKIYFNKFIVSVYKYLIFSFLWIRHITGLPLLWNQREKWLLFQVLTKERWETTGRSGESTGRSQNISLINCTTFKVVGAL
jgi:hypothetical protein